MAISSSFHPLAPPLAYPPGAPQAAAYTIFSAASALFYEVTLILHCIRSFLALYLCTITIQQGPEPETFVSDALPLNLHAQEENFEQFIVEMTQDHDIYLSNRDLDMLENLEGIGDFKYDDCISQFESAGICVELPKGTKMPRINPAKTVSFQYGPKQRIVHLEPEKLTALGFSVLAWVVIPNERDAAQFVDVIRHVTFRNALVDHLIDEVKDDLPSKQVVVPMGWLYCLDLPEEFLQEHADYGDMAAILGRGEVEKIAPVGCQIKRTDESVNYM